jgi:hypothetical protein
MFRLRGGVRDIVCNKLVYIVLVVESAKISLEIVLLYLEIKLTNVQLL